jgi:DNA polymerase-3 subunit gamma/tau
MSQALYRKWRPQSWEAVIGQDHVVQTLRNAISADRVAHAYLFAGPRGTGKTTTARLLAKAVNCKAAELAERPCNHCEHCLAVNQGRFMDLIEIDAASNTSVEDVRALREKINYRPNQGIYKVYIIDEVHMLSTAAFNALLKTLEEPPPHAIFILATTEVHKIPATVMSRCQQHEFRRLPVNDIVSYLKMIAEGEGIQIEPDALTLVARQSTGAMRDAISLLDQLASGGKKITLEMAQKVLGTAASQTVLDVVQALIDQQTGRGLDAIHKALDAGSDPRQFARQIVDYLRSLLLIKMDNAKQVEASQEMLGQMKHHAQAINSGHLLLVIRAFNSAASEARGNWQPSLPLEIAFIEALVRSQDGSPVNAQEIREGRKPAEASGGGNAVPVTPPTEAIRPAKAAAQSDETSRSEKSDQTASASDAEQTFQRIMENWRQVRSAVRQVNPATEGLLNSCKPMGVKDGVLYLSFSTPLLKQKMEAGNHIENIHKALGQVLGKELPVRCFVATSGSAGLPPDVEGDGMVAAALRDLGGEVVDIQ